MDITCTGRHCGQCCGSFCDSYDNKKFPLSDGEIEILLDLAQYSFLPVASNDHDIPVYRESSSRSEAEYAASLLDMQEKGLIRIDYDTPLLNYEYHLYPDCRHHGSMVLTSFGQDVAEQVWIQGQ
jgi:hypothetical protein